MKPLRHLLTCRAQMRTPCHSLPDVAVHSSPFLHVIRLESSFCSQSHFSQMTDCVFCGDSTNVKDAFQTIAHMLLLITQTPAMPDHHSTFMFCVFRRTPSRMWVFYKTHIPVGSPGCTIWIHCTIWMYHVNALNETQQVVGHVPFAFFRQHL